MEDYVKNLGSQLSFHQPSERLIQKFLVTQNVALYVIIQ